MKTVDSDVKTLDTGKFRFKLVTLNRIYLFAAETLGKFIKSFFQLVLVRYGLDVKIFSLSISQYDD